MRLDSDDFALFGIERRFALDRDALDQRWRALQGEVHPDRYAAEGAAAQRAALQWAVRVNEAHQRLKDPLKRAALLCELAGVPVEAENNTAMPAAFLVQQMEWREALDETKGADAVQALADNVAAHRRHALADLAEAIDVRHDMPSAVRQVRALMFIERFVHDVEERLEALEE